MFIIWPIDIEIETPRCYSTSSANNSREPSPHSDASSMDYVDRVKELANNPSWADQVETENLQGPSLSYTPLKKGTEDTISAVPVNKTSQVPYVNNPNNVCSPQDIKLAAISYIVNQLMDLLLWNSRFCSISIFGLNKCLDRDVKTSHALF